MSKIATFVKRTSVTAYQFSLGRGGGRLVTAHVDEWKGELTIVSNHGMWSYQWGTHCFGPDIASLTEFIACSSVEYLSRKLWSGRRDDTEFSPEKTAAAMKRRLIELRRHPSRISKNAARDTWDAIEIASTHDYADVFFFDLHHLASTWPAGMDDPYCYNRTRPDHRRPDPPGGDPARADRGVQGEHVRALTLTQPWAGLVAYGVKTDENRMSRVINETHFGSRFAIHASREIDPAVYDRIRAILGFEGQLCDQPWYPLTRITQAVLGVATVMGVMRVQGDRLVPAGKRQLTLGAPVVLRADHPFAFPDHYVYQLADIRRLRSTVACRGHQGFWCLTAELAREVQKELL